VVPSLAWDGADLGVVERALHPGVCPPAREVQVPELPPPVQEGRCKATWKRKFKIPWREAGPPNHHDDRVDSDRERFRFRNFHPLFRMQRSGFENNCFTEM